eukprot:2581346-Pyramimonas_sp.AAC.1
MQSNAKQCEAIRSNAKQCKARQGSAKQCKAMPSSAKQGKAMKLWFATLCYSMLRFDIRVDEREWTRREWTRREWTSASGGTDDGDGRRRAGRTGTRAATDGGDGRGRAGQPGAAQAQLPQEGSTAWGTNIPSPTRPL